MHAHESPSQQSRRLRFPHPVGMICLVLWLAALLRFGGLGSDSLWTDEYGQLLVQQRALAEVLPSVRTHAGASPFDYLVGWGAIRLFGESDWALRFPSASWGILTVTLVVALGRRLWGLPVGLLAALLLALSPFHLRYSQEARFYSAWIALGLANLLALWEFARQPSKRSALVWVGTALLAALTHYYFWLLLVAQGLWLWRYARRQLPLFGAMIVPVLLPGLLWLLYDQPWQERWGLMDWEQEGALSILVQVGGHFFREMAGPNIGVVTLREAPWKAVLLLLPLSIGGLALVGLVAALRQPRERSGLFLLLLPLLVNLVGGFASTWRAHYPIGPRQFLLILPLLLLLAARGIQATRLWLSARTSPPTGWRLAVLGGSLGAILAVGGVANFYGWEKSVYRESGRQLATLLDPSEPVLVAVGSHELLARYYPGIVLPVETQSCDQATAVAELLPPAIQGDAVWLFTPGNRWLLVYCPPVRAWYDAACQPSETIPDLARCRLPAMEGLNAAPPHCAAC